MNLKDWSKWVSAFIFAVLVIAVYKTFDNFYIITIWFGRLIELLKPFFVGGVIAYLLYPPCSWLEGRCEKSKFKFMSKHARGFSVVFVYLATILLVFLILRLITPVIYNSIMEFVKQLPNYYNDILTALNNFDLVTMDIDGMMNEMMNNISLDGMFKGMELRDISKYAEGVAVFSSTIISVFMGVAISVYILLDRDSLGDLIKRTINLYVRPKYAKPIIKYVKKINEFLYKYLYCQLLDACIIAIVSFIGLSIIGVKYAPVFALSIGILNMVPYFGSIIGAVVTIVFTIFTGGISTAVWTGVFLIVLQQIDANVMQPKLVSSNLNVRPFWIILGIVIGGGYFGLIGIVLAAPFVAVIKIMVQDIFEAREKSMDARSASMRGSMLIDDGD